MSPLRSELGTSLLSLGKKLSLVHKATQNHLAVSPEIPMDQVLPLPPAHSCASLLRWVLKGSRG